MLRSLVVDPILTNVLSVFTSADIEFVVADPRIVTPVNVMLPFLVVSVTGPPKVEPTPVVVIDAVPLPVHPAVNCVVEFSVI